MIPFSKGHWVMVYVIPSIKQIGTQLLETGIRQKMVAKVLETTFARSAGTNESN